MHTVLSTDEHPNVPCTSALHREYAKARTTAAHREHRSAARPGHRRHARQGSPCTLPPPTSTSPQDTTTLLTEGTTTLLAAGVPPRCSPEHLHAACRSTSTLVAEAPPCCSPEHLHAARRKTPPRCSPELPPQLARRESTTIAARRRTTTLLAGAPPRCSPEHLHAARRRTTTLLAGAPPRCSPELLHAARRRTTCCSPTLLAGAPPRCSPEHGPQPRPSGPFELPSDAFGSGEQQARPTPSPPAAVQRDPYMTRGRTARLNAAAAPASAEKPSRATGDTPAQDHYVSLLLNHCWSAPRITYEPPRIDSDRRHRARRLRRRGGACSTWRSVQDNQWFSPLARGKPRDPVVRGARLAERREQSRTILTACQNGEAEHLTRPASPGQGSQTLTAVLTCLTDL